MADFSSQQGRDYGRPPNHGHTSNHQRDAAYANIFGAPPPGRAQTMGGPQMSQDGRSRTMTADMMPRAPPARQPMPPMSNGYPPQQQSNHQQHHAAPNFSRAQTNTFNHPSQRPHMIQAHSMQQRAPPAQQQYPQPIRTDRRPYGQPQRLDERAPSLTSSTKPMPNRYPGGPPAPAMSNDGFRTQSLATGQRPPYQGPMAPANAFRQAPYMNHTASTTQYGRVIPQRPEDERTMSMSSYGREANNAVQQTNSGRIIPTRRRESSNTDDYPVEQQDQSSTWSASSTSTVKVRSPSQSSIPPSRTMSMASTIGDRTDTMTSRPSGSKTNSQALMVSQRRSPLVYPALLSRVAQTFRDRIGVNDQEKDGLVYKNGFTGAEAVDLISYIIKTTDRNLALLLGRSLDAQKFFHDVTYAHRLRDSSNEIYEFRETVIEDDTDVNGVFTLLTECYSPTCTRDQLCYSIACPRRLEQQARLNMKPLPGLRKEDSSASLHEDANDEQKLWINTVSKEVADSIDDKEKKRQEVISEIMYTERDFVKDLEYLRDFWMKPLRNPATSPVPEHRREKFVRTVFSNCQEVYMVNSRMAESLTRRQQQSPVVRNVGDIFLDYVPHFSPFIKYGANQLFGKYEFEHEKRTNVHFSKFVDEVERMKESRKLELNGYLTKPTTRLARYPLLLENVAKYTADDNPDKQDIPKAIAMIRDFLSKVNTESGKAENHFNLMQLSRDLKWRNGEFVDLKLTEENRRIVFKAQLKRSPTDAQGDIAAYLFDHAVLLVKVKTVNKREEQRVHRKPIPLELLVIGQMEEFLPKIGIAKRPSSSLIPGTRTNTMTGQRPDAKQQGFPITFKHLGKGGYDITLYCSSQIQQQKWMEHIEAQQRNVRERSNIYVHLKLNEGFFNSTNRVNCCVPIDGGRKLVYGTDFGIYVSDRKPKDASFKPRRVLDCKSVTQIDVLENYSILLVLSDKTLYSYSTDALESDDALNKRARKICHANLFKIGVCNGAQLVCCVRTSALSTTVKVYEPMENMIKKQKKSGFAKMLTGGQDVLKPYKELYIPSEASSIHFLRSKLCIGCARGFEVVSLETLETQSLLDQADTSLDFVSQRENMKPIHIERLQSEFLLSYMDYSFFVNRNGWRTRPDWQIVWEGNPQAFAIFGSYILAFEPSFIEIRHLESGALVHIVTAKNIRMLHYSTREVCDSLRP
ncbi:CNH-domain-containing protein [Pseudovirgaria hyperparasitica]|uniref:CNH-domain-containing protein n=1 Tax=Pseudovirgaria hyperparasitica TaxID=470096 RepID=A0A6A6WA72_9PEZI|nr:CNH-domain-containing protein [Pseudovirgaria hyperparasitica]KAF2758487.1 CNH-domain-containing protein [Pseudovirgaria hyperparasitica]